MSTIQDNDFLMVERGGTLYKVPHSQLSDLDSTDLLMVERGGNLYKVAFSNSGNIDPSDLLMVERSGNLYKTVASSLSFSSGYVTALRGSPVKFTMMESSSLDNSSNAYILARESTSRDSIAIKLDETGVKQWVTALHYNADVTPRDISADNSGNVYVSGYVHESNVSNYDMFLAKLNSSGTLQWSRRYGLQSQSDYAYNHAVDGSGNIYVTGATWISDNYKPMIVKYNSSGTLQWQKYISVSRGIPYSLAVDAAGNAILGSRISNKASISKWNSSGTLIWHKLIDLSGSLSAVATDASNNVYVAVDEDGITIAKLNSSGEMQWQRNVKSSITDYSGNIMTTSSGNVILNWSTAVNNALISFDASGNEQWQRIISDSSGLINSPAMTSSISNANSILSASNLGTNSTGRDVVVAMLPTSGSGIGVYNLDMYTVSYDSTTQFSVSTPSYTVSTPSYSVINLNVPESAAGITATSFGVVQDGLVN